MSLVLPRILALETSTRHGSVAVALGPRLLAQRFFSPGMRHAAELLPAIGDLLGGQSWRPGDLDHVYLSTGPGSFTGLRIAVAVARSFHLALGCRLAAVPTLDVLARNAPADAGWVVPVLDAKRGQVFAARYERLSGGVLSRVADPALVDPTAFIRATPKPVVILGEGVAYHRAALLAGVERPGDLMELPASLWYPTAAQVHALGYALALEGRFADPAALLPTYIRLPEAEEVYRKRHGLPI